MLKFVFVERVCVQRSLLQARLLPCFEKLVLADATDIGPAVLPLDAVAVTAGLRRDLTDCVLLSATMVPLLKLAILLAPSETFFFWLLSRKA